MGQQLTFVQTRFDEKGNNGLGEWKAIFVKGDSDLAKAFKSASAQPGLKAMGGVVTMNMEQISHRLEQLNGNEAHKDTVDQLQHGKTAIQAKLAPKPTVAHQALRA